jgi:hypothetical protein
VPALPGTSQMKGTRFRGQIRSESPDTTGPDPGGSPPRTAVTTHSQIRRSVRRVRDGPQSSLSGVELCVMILVDGLIVDWVAVSVAVSSLIM